MMLRKQTLLPFSSPRFGLEGVALALVEYQTTEAQSEANGWPSRS
jgi:hypothetical protein